MRRPWPCGGRIAAPTVCGRFTRTFPWGQVDQFLGSSTASVNKRRELTPRSTAGALACRNVASGRSTAVFTKPYSRRDGMSSDRVAWCVLAAARRIPLVAAQEVPTDASGDAGCGGPDGGGCNPRRPLDTPSAFAAAANDVRTRAEGRGPTRRGLRRTYRGTESVIRPSGRGGLPFAGGMDAVCGDIAAFAEPGSDSLAVNLDDPDPAGTPGRTRAFGRTMA